MSTPQITVEDVQKIAQLARLQLSEKELKKAAEDLAGILNHFSQIQHIDTTNVPAADDMSGMKNVSREDAAAAEALCKPEDVIKTAPETHNGQIKVTAVFS